MRVLIVEDDKLLSEMYREAFEQAKHEVIVADGAQDALNKLDKEDTIDFLILDMLLPGRSGVEILHELSSYADWQNIPVFMLSDIARDSIKISDDDLAKYGIKKIIYKPAASPSEIIALAEEAVVNE